MVCGGRFHGEGLGKRRVGGDAQTQSQCQTDRQPQADARVHGTHGQHQQDRRSAQADDDSFTLAMKPGVTDQTPTNAPQGAGSLGKTQHQAGHGLAGASGITQEQGQIGKEVCLAHIPGDAGHEQQTNIDIASDLDHLPQGGGHTHGALESAGFNQQQA